MRSRLGVLAWSWACWAGAAWSIGCSESVPRPSPDLGVDDAGSEDAGAICTAGERTCEGSTARVCVATGDGYNQIDCPNGCDHGACAPASLEAGWVVHQYDLLNDGIKTPARYMFEQDGLVAIQSANPMASVYYRDADLPEGVVIRGRFSVQTGGDDDLIGFVFGWQDPEHFYLLDWKQATQNDGTCGLAEEGATLKLVRSDTTVDDCTDFWRTAGTDRVAPIVPVAANPDGWEDFVDYELVLRFRPGDIDIRITPADGSPAVTVTSTDTTYRAGKFGFFNYSQGGVRYELFSISPSD